MIDYRHPHLVALLRDRAANASAQRPAFTHLAHGEASADAMSFAELDRRARRLAAHLQACTRRGDRVLLVHPPGLDYIVAFFACVYAGVIAVPAMPPANARTLPRLRLIARDATPAIALAPAAIAQRMRQWQGDAGDAFGAQRWLASDELDEPGTEWACPDVTPADIAFLQYTSGSTGAPKGVMVSHGNILANLELIQDSFGMRPADVFVSWLPPHHDMGLIGKILYPIYTGGHCVQFPPAAFIASPHRWLQAITDHRARLTAAPNFAYDLCIDKVSEVQKRTLDLASLDFALNGAELVRASTLRRFAQAFAACGFRAGASTPVYGSAEATLLMTSRSREGRIESPAVLAVDRERLSAGHVARASAAGAADALEVVAVGPVRSKTHHVAIVDPASSLPLPDDCVGEVWAFGPSIAEGYWNRPEESARTFVTMTGDKQERALRTGDLGFVHDGNLFIAGRIKDLMIFGGRKVYPHDVEAIVEQLDPAFRKNGCAAFSLEDDTTTRLVLVQELELRSTARLASVIHRLRAEIAEQCEVFHIAAVLLVKAGDLPRTSSGKLQRSRCREMFRANQFIALDTWREDDRAQRQDEETATEAVAAPDIREIARTLTEIWTSLLGIADIPRGRDFFGLGGHSLTAAQALARIRDRLGVELSLQDFFEAPTLDGQAARIAALRLMPATHPAIEPVVRTTSLPLSFAQRRLWLLEQVDAGAAQGHQIAFGLRLQGLLKRDVLRGALDRLVARHEALRTTIAGVQDGDDADLQAVQVIGPADTPFALIEHDLRALADDARPGAIDELVQAEARAPFDLAAGPLIRGRLLQLRDDEYLLLVTQHHVISDGWSIGVLVRELGALYAAFAQGQPDPLPPLALQYADYAVWQRQGLQGERLQEQLDYWRGHLAGAPALLELPTDRARPAVQSYRGQRVRLELAPTLVAAVRAASQRHGVTVFMTLLAAWAALLARLCGQPELVIGTPVANRGRAELEPLVGFFVNTLALRLSTHPELRVADWLQQVKATCLGAYAHQDLPFEQVVEAVRPARSLGHSPLFQVMLALDNTPQRDPLALPGLVLTPLETARSTTQFDLSLALTDTGSALAGYLEYASDLFDAASIERLGGHFTTLLEALSTRDDELIDRLPLLSPSQRHHLLHDFNATAVAPPAEQLVHRLFEAQAASTPAAIAVVHEARTLTYAELNERANVLAHRLLALGVQPDDRVALCVERGLEMVVGLLAILKSGAAYVPLDPAYPPQRLAFMLADSAPVALLTQASLRDALLLAPESGPELPSFLLDDPPATREPAEALRRNPAIAALTPRHLAYVIYTSGSTGQPKGVMVEHAALANFLASMAREPGLAREDVLLAVTTLSFDIAALELHLPLMQGARLVVLDRAGAADPALLAQAVERHAATVLQATPATWRLLLDHGWAGSPALKALCGGEALPTDLAGRLAARVGAVWNMYGPTETTVWSICRKLAPHDGAASSGYAVEAIGRPIANTQVHLLDTHREPVPVGAIGEIYIGGAGVSRGYLNRPELTAERFVDDPFADACDRGARAKLYRTGDLARRSADGTIHYLGRNDFQVKIRGFRIEPGEIEARLRADERLRDAAVVARKGATGDDVLVAYVVPCDGATVQPDELRARLAESLPSQMLPQIVVTLEALPLTPNGKVDRRALPTPQPDRGAVAAAPFVAPRNDVEAAVAAIWAEVLHLDRIGVDDNFFDIGGHSLLAVQVASRVRTALGRDVAVRTIFEAPTVARLARHWADAAPADARLRPLTARSPANLPRPSFAQERMWFVQSLEGPGTTYNMPVSLRLRGPLDVDALRASLQDLVAHHEILRANVVSGEDGLRLEIAPQRNVVLHALVLAESEVAGCAAAHARYVFDLSCGPLLAASLIEVGALEHVLLLNIHHIVADGWSLRILFDHWMRLYDARRTRSPNPLPALPVQYADYALWQRDAMHEATLARQLAWWTTQLRGAPELLNLPTDRPRPAIQSIESGAHAGFVDSALLTRLHELGRSEDASLFMTLMAAFALLLSRLAGQTDVVIGTPVANRNREELEHLIGLFVGNLALRADLSGEPSFRELLGRVRRTALDAYSNSDVPFERLVDALALKRDLSRNPVFQVYFNMLNLPAAGFQPPGLVVEELVGTQLEAKFDLTLYAQETAGGLALQWVYDRTLFDAERVEEMARQFESLLAQVADAPDAGTARYSLVTAQATDVLPDPAARLPDAWAGAVHELFEREGARRPEAVAIASHEATWRYRELGAHVERIACWLQNRGIVRGDVVAIHAARNATLPAAILGVLKAGAAFTILDPAHPVAHSRACIAVARPRAWLQIAPPSDDARELHAGAGPVAALDLHATVGNTELLALAGRAARHVDIGADDLALIAFTSGSTGVPKAVEGRHGSLTHFLPWTRERFALGPDDCFAMLSPLSHDPLQRDVFNALCLGARLAIPHPDTIAPRRLAAWMVRAGVTAANLAPAMARLLADPAVDVTATPLPALRNVFMIGDVLTRQDVVRLHALAPAARVTNLYGTTETQRALGCFEIDRERFASDTREIVPLGRGMPGSQLLVLNAAGLHAGIGEPGEIHLRSPHLARGYRDEVELTARRFIANPFTRRAGDRVYRTGDIGRYLLDGTVECLGRTDTQVKLRGFRIELGAIESLLAQHPGVREAVAVVRGAGLEDSQLVAYVVGRTGAPDAAALRAHLRARVPGYMQPAAFVFLERLPLTPNGKVDRAALPAPEPAQAEAAFVAPRTRTETQLAAIWADVLKLEAVGITDNFFESGGHSLRAAQAVARIRHECGVDLPLRRLFEMPTVAALADLIDADQREFDEIEL